MVTQVLLRIVVCAMYSTETGMSRASTFIVVTSGGAAAGFGGSRLQAVSVAANTSVATRTVHEKLTSGQGSKLVVRMDAVGKTEQRL